jgi:hypothetical protein
MKTHFDTALAKVLSVISEPTTNFSVIQGLADAAQKLTEAQKTYFNRTPSKANSED